MGEFIPLFSGSSGNSAYIAKGNHGLMIDAGMSCKSLVAGLDAAGVSPEQVKAILVTHEHSDHICGLRVFLNKYPALVVASEGTLTWLADHDHLPKGIHCKVAGQAGQEIEGMVVRGFSTSHDAAESLGFTIELGETKVGYATDLGVVTDQITQQLAACDTVLLESNYDVGMMKCCTYPNQLKQRITGVKGHLSNDDCAALAVKLVSQKTTRLFLGHLSRESNLPDIAHQTTANALIKAKMVQNKDYILRVANRHHPSKGMFF